MAGILFAPPHFVLVNNAGVPRSAAKAYFYQAGTSTLANVYTTSALSTPHASPVVADSSGTFDAIYLNPSAGYDYKVIFKDSAGVTLETWDNLPVGSSFALATHAHATTDITSGTMANARISASNVTQHQASLAIVADQVTCAVRDVAGTTDSPTSADEEDIITLSSASPTTVTLNSGVCGVGNSIAFKRLGAGSVTFAAGASQTIRSPGSRLTIAEQYGTAVATYIATNTWDLAGV